MRTAQQTLVDGSRFQDLRAILQSLDQMRVFPLNSNSNDCCSVGSLHSKLWRTCTDCAVLKLEGLALSGVARDGSRVVEVRSLGLGVGFRIVDGRLGFANSKRAGIVACTQVMDGRSRYGLSVSVIGGLPPDLRPEEVFTIVVEQK